MDYSALVKASMAILFGSILVDILFLCITNRLSKDAQTVSVLSLLRLKKSVRSVSELPILTSNTGVGTGPAR